MIEIKNLKFKYNQDQTSYTLNDVSFHVKHGEWLSIVGHNGSGKSTTARLIGGLLVADSGQIIVDGQELTEETVWDIRDKIGMVFQNPDNQFVGATVEDDVAFGLENKGLPYKEMVSRVQEALSFVGMMDFKDREPARLSGGQKQRVAIAGIIAMRPSILILDEATSMLDPEGRQELIQYIEDIRQQYGMTVLSITHDLDGRTIMGISLENVSYTYQSGTPFERRALFDMTVTIKDGSYTAFIGHTGSGKSTIMQLLNGLYLPTSGQVKVDDTIINSQSKNKEIKPIRKKVGLVFQFPESQLFAETVLEDIAFGPQNFGVSKEEAEQRALESLRLVGLSDELRDQNPFDLSGGQMRRVAIAGILAMQPDILVLDEPTAGLDPQGRKELMSLFKQLHLSGITIVLVTHLMDDVADYATAVNVMEKGRLVLSGTPKDVFQKVAFLKEKQLGVPKITEFALQLQEKGYSFESLPITIEEFVEVLVHG